MHSYHSSPLVGLIASSSWVPLRGEGAQGASMLYLLAVPSWPSAEPLAPCQKHWNKKTTNDPTVLPHANNNPSPHVSAFCVSTLCVCGSFSLQEGHSPSIEVSTRGIKEHRLRFPHSDLLCLLHPGLLCLWFWDVTQFPQKKMGMPQSSSQNVPHRVNVRTSNFGLVASYWLGAWEVEMWKILAVNNLEATNCWETVLITLSSVTPLQDHGIIELPG